MGTETAERTEPAAPPTNGLAITALCLGIAGAVIGLVPILGLFAIALGAAGLVVGLVALKNSKRRGRRKMSWAAVVVSVLAVVLGIIGVAIVDDALDDLDRDLQRIDQEYQRDLERLGE